MKANSISTSGMNWAVIVLGILAALLVLVVLTGRKLPLLSTDRAALLALVVTGMIMCAQGGIGKMATRGEWLHPLSIISYLLGAIAVIMGIAALFGKQIPPLSSYYQSFLVVTAIMVVKLMLTAIHRLWL